jgi:lysozyme
MSHEQNDSLILTERGANLVKHFESCLKPVKDGFKAYKCPAGVLTIGWGHTNHHGIKFTNEDVWSQADCDAAFTDDMKGFEDAVKHLVTVPLTAYQFDALVSFTYNVGEGALSKSTLLKKLNAGDYKGAAQEFKRWNKANGKELAGLTRRRASEALMFENIPDENYDGKADTPPSPHPMPQIVDIPED